MYGRLADAIRARANMSTNQSIIRVGKKNPSRNITIKQEYYIYFI